MVFLLTLPELHENEQVNVARFPINSARTKTSNAIGSQIPFLRSLSPPARFPGPHPVVYSYGC